MDNASSIEEQLQTLKTLHSNVIDVILFMFPIFPELTDWQAIIDQSKNYFYHKELVEAKNIFGK